MRRLSAEGGRGEKREVGKNRLVAQGSLGNEMPRREPGRAHHTFFLEDVIAVVLIDPTINRVQVDAGQNSAQRRLNRSTLATRSPATAFRRLGALASTTTTEDRGEPGSRAGR